MSLVDYAPSSDEDEAEISEEEDKKESDPPPLRSSPNPDFHTQSLIASSHQQSGSASHSSEPSIEKLPDASLLFESPDFLSHQVSAGNHSSRVTAAKAESASRKRESNGSVFSRPSTKHPRGNMPHSRNLPDTVGGLLVPPQLNGRSNVVTEDIGKLFVRRLH
ncbi:uncharacterized protein LOC143852952 [Tasmannia lanceolata]|uniref:uncharacterized protein LOC143852952 n=1 Tax=Tasmannia lanceolata TaxID=3420 RepID=UPI004062D600